MYFLIAVTLGVASLVFTSGGEGVIGISCLALAIMCLIIGAKNESR